MCALAFGIGLDSGPPLAILELHVHAQATTATGCHASEGRVCVHKRCRPLAQELLAFKAMPGKKILTRPVKKGGCLSSTEMNNSAARTTCDCRWRQTTTVVHQQARPSRPAWCRGNAVGSPRLSQASCGAVRWSVVKRVNCCAGLD